MNMFVFKRLPVHNICDDGGPGAEISDCSFGTDCADCGLRQQLATSPPPPPPVSFCSDTCDYPADDICDDGGRGLAELGRGLLPPRLM